MESSRFHYEMKVTTSALDQHYIKTKKKKQEKTVTAIVNSSKYKTLIKDWIAVDHYTYLKFH